MRKAGLLFSTALILAFAISTVSAQTTAFSYQGKLTDGGGPANGAYEMQFKLFTTGIGGTQIGSTLSDVTVNVTAGIFTVNLDFGTNIFTGATRWLELAVRHNSGETYTILSPREQIVSSPYSVRTLSTAMADDSQKLGGIDASQYVTNTSSAFIRNQTTQQAASNFNISGNGSFGGQVGIGTSSPGSALEIRGTSFGAQQRLTDTVSGNSLVLQGGAGGNMKISGYNYGTSTAVSLSLSVDGANTVLNPNGGYVGIGTDPTALLHIKSLNGSMPFVEGPTGIYTGYNFRSGPSGNWGVGTIDNFAGGALIFRRQTFVPMVILPTGNVGIDTLDPQRLLHVNGRARIGTIPLEASSATVCFNAAGDLLQCGASSLLLKKNITPFSFGLDIVRRLSPINYEWKEDGRSDFGLGAEDVAKVLPELAYKNNTGEIAGVKYEKINLVLINAVKEQQQQIEKQQDEIEDLRAVVCSIKPDEKICNK